MGGGRGRLGKKVQGLRSIIGRYKRDRGMSRTVQEMGKPKNIYVQPMDMNYELRGGNSGGKGCTGQREAKLNL